MVSMEIHSIIAFSLLRDVAGAHGVRVKMIMILGSCLDLSCVWRTDHFFNSSTVVFHAYLGAKHSPFSTEIR